MAAACTSSAGPIRMADRPPDIPDTAISSLLFTLWIRRSSLQIRRGRSALPAAVHVPDAQRSHAHDAFAVAASAWLRNARTASAGSDAPYTAEPATKTSAPASAHRSMVDTETPPSTWSQSSRPCLLI